ncbi:PLC-like phosphodiesterase, TIM beta/alpha-barrel domain [Penicillium roqueforti FM164]|uniref:PLC-like phosphodiesterase, TIM beta/alpha-barrel domain n=1 Tax=Penicillium roqueforti (strain FM164) TaxID=1365484 RepID=W6QBS1_PENRF|nr:PLC-like phosphodiesterase, TIM beta/alpha-barrel domain [Penicillium roqueforti FM164]
MLSTLLLLQPVLAVSEPGILVPRASEPSVISSTTPSMSNLAVTTCNGRSEYCTRSYSNITFVGSHDSAFVGPLPQQNQNIDIKAQLDMGIRYLQVQTHRSILDGNIIELCHTSCLLEDAGTLKSFLTTIKNWLDTNPNEVVSLLLTNGDSIAITEFGDTFSGSGIDNYAYVPFANPLLISDWPTLGDMISRGKRLVVFLDYGADTTKVNFIQDEFAYYFETAYDVTDSFFSNCSIDRPSDTAATGRMGIVNHFLDVDIFGIKIPARHKADTTNTATGPGSIGAQAGLCAKLYGNAPNVLLVDFVDKGDVITAQKNLNGF